MHAQKRALERLRRSAVAGVFTVEMACAAGVSRGAIRHRRERGYWRHVVGRAYCDPEWTGRAGAVWLRMVGASLSWRDGVVCLRTAGLRHGFPIADDGNAHVVVADARRRVAGLIPHRRGLGPGDVEHHGPVVLTSRARTAVDCLMHLPPAEAESLMTWVRTRQLLTTAELREAVAAREGRRGVRQLRLLTELTSTGAMSALERELHRLLRMAGVRGWSADSPVRVGGRIIARADVLFAAERVILEADGKAYHQDFEADRQRLNALTLAGYTVLRFTWRQVTAEPEEVIRQVRQVLMLSSAS